MRMWARCRFLRRGSSSYEGEYWTVQASLRSSKQHEGAWLDAESALAQGIVLSIMTVTGEAAAGTAGKRLLCWACMRACNGPSYWN